MRASHLPRVSTIRDCSTSHFFVLNKPIIFNPKKKNSSKKKFFLEASLKNFLGFCFSSELSRIYLRVVPPTVRHKEDTNDDSHGRRHVIVACFLLVVGYALVDE